MPDVAEDFDDFENLIIIVGVLIISYLGYKLFSTGIPGLVKATAADLNTVGHPEQYVGTSQPLTAVQAQTIAWLIVTPGSQYSLSPDKTQIWFPNGAYYDNPTGHVFDNSGVDHGALFQADGVTINAGATAFMNTFF